MAKKNMQVGTTQDQHSQIKSLEKQLAQANDALAQANDALEMSLAVSPITDNNFFPNGMSSSYTDRNSWDRKKIFAESLRAWRVNPIARRLVRLTRSFLIGKGLSINVKDDEKTNAFLNEWWNDPLNAFKKNIKRWVDENQRTGNLFFLFNVQPNGMTYIRAIPAEQIDEIETKENDVEQEIKFLKDSTGEEYWPAYDPEEDQDLFMVHYAVNQPVGSPWGEGDLPNVLVWIGRFSTWLEDRVRLNHFRSVFMYIVQGQFTNAEEKLARQKSLNSNPPKPGSILVTDPSEQWGIMSAQLDSFDATLDGMSIKKNIATGYGVPLHYLAEPEGSTQTTAEAAGTPTFRAMEESQDELFEMLQDMARIALEVRAKRTGDVNPKAQIIVTGPDITERDNATLALAFGRAYPNLADLYDRGLDEKEFMRLAYKTFAEVWDGTTHNLEKKPLVKPNDGTNPIPDNKIKDSKSDPTDPKDTSSE